MVLDTPALAAHASHIAFLKTGFSTSVLGVLTLQRV